MANPVHLEILKRGVAEWNEWRSDNPDTVPDLFEAKLTNVDMSRANLSDANLEDARLDHANLTYANLCHANLVQAYMAHTDLSHADLFAAILYEADLRYAKLIGANLERADFTLSILRGARMMGAKLNRAQFIYVDFSRAFLNKTDFYGALLGGSSLSDVNLSIAENLQHVRHQTSSSLGTNTISVSAGKIPPEFLRGCGLSNWEILMTKLYDPELTGQQIKEIQDKIHDLRVGRPKQNPLFISYSHSDSDFVDALENKLNLKGIRFWRDVRDGTSGPLEKQVDLAIERNPTVLVILSNNSVKSDWVEHEVRKARELQKQIGRHVLCPVALDNSWKNCNWPQRIVEQLTAYNILDFSKWNDEDVFSTMFNKLIDGLKLFYK